MWHLNSLQQEEKHRLTDSSLREKLRPLFKQGSNDKPAVLLVHGFTGSPFDLRPLHHMCERLGHTVHSMLLPGHGGYSPRELENATPEDWTKAVRKAIRSLSLFHTGVHLVGFSVGGVLVLDCADEPDVKSVTVLNPFTAVPMRWYYLLTPRMWSTVLAPFMPYVCRPGDGNSTECDIHNSEGRSLYEPSYQHISVQAYRRAQDYCSEVWNRMKHPPVKLSYFYSSQDKVSSPVLMQREAGRLVCHAADQLHVLPNSGHVVLYDNDRDYVLKNIEYFWNHS